MQDFLQRVRAVLVADFLALGFDATAAGELADIEMELSR